jgi:hypothetical protein
MAPLILTLWANYCMHNRLCGSDVMYTIQYNTTQHNTIQYNNNTNMAPLILTLFAAYDMHGRLWNFGVIYTPTIVTLTWLLISVCHPELWVLNLSLLGDRHLRWKSPTEFIRHQVGHAKFIALSDCQPLLFIWIQFVFITKYCTLFTQPPIGCVNKVQYLVINKNCM